MSDMINKRFRSKTCMIVPNGILRVNLSYVIIQGLKLILKHLHFMA